VVASIALPKTQSGGTQIFPLCWLPSITGAQRALLVLHKCQLPESSHTTTVRACHAGAPPGGQLLRPCAYKATRYAAYKWCFIASRPQVTSSFKILRVICLGSVYVESLLLTIRNDIAWVLAVTLCCLVVEYQPCTPSCLGCKMETTGSP
jgi:hypothetical protein